jgi:[ribosomal protein S18]-alanine N-acetyltransferase
MMPLAEPVPIQPVQIRRMTAADLPQVMAIAASLPEAPDWPESAYLTALDPESTPRRIALVAAGPQNQDIQGFLVARLLSPQAELESIAVSAGSQRRGLGRLLFNALVQEGLNWDGLNSDGLKSDRLISGILEILLEVRASNRTALAFYHSAGFIQTGLRSAYYADPVEDAVLMRFLVRSPRT